ncbi:copper chaperone PCu(A)C [Dinoroseobacter sp. S375]|uniref:copper chaperone PCu(A)C n=1 Tax=Dinoroseobacter sp. S375 TaxID=3415136 RepID=UPI003C7D6CB5
MSLKSLILAAGLGFAALPAVAMDTSIMVMDPYARAASPVAKSGAAFMEIMNHGAEDDRLVSASSPTSARVELHTHIDDGNGVMLMREVEDGFTIPAGETYMLKRGGDHVMFMGLKESWSQGDMVPVTLVFEKAGELTLEIPVDLERAAEHGGHDHQHGHGDHSGHKH